MPWPAAGACSQGSPSGRVVRYRNLALTLRAAVVQGVLADVTVVRAGAALLRGAELGPVRHQQRLAGAAGVVEGRTALAALVLRQEVVLQAGRSGNEMMTNSGGSVLATRP